ncbi:MAG: hypothetical protein R3E66_13680 [bacterium]
MVDTQRFNIGPAAVRITSVVAHELARRHGKVAVLQVVPYVPLDVDSVARILESLDDLSSTHRIQGEDGIDYYTFDDTTGAVDLEAGAHLQEQPNFARNVSSLCDDADWSRKARAQHVLLQLIATSTRKTFSCDFLASRSKLPTSKIQSALNDFVAQKYAHMVVDEDEALYIFPDLSYPPDLLARNLQALAPSEESGRTNRFWWFVAIAAAVVLIIVLLELV